MSRVSLSGVNTPAPSFTPQPSTPNPFTLPFGVRYKADWRISTLPVLNWKGGRIVLQKPEARARPWKSMGLKGPGGNSGGNFVYEA